MKIYTKTGDEGTTQRYSGEIIPKDHPIIILCGKIDSLQSAIDSAKILLEQNKIDLLNLIQKKLEQIAGEISLGNPGKKVNNEVTAADIKFLEDSIDYYSKDITMFVRFNTEKSTRLNETRTRCRELEVILTKPLRDKKVRPEMYAYINRLSDLLYFLACSEE